MVKTSRRTLELEESPTLAIAGKAKELKAQGIDVIGFGAGEPDFNTPENVKKAAIKAIETGKTRYTAVGGINELKDAVAAKFKRDNNLNYSREEIIISCGGKHSIFNLLMATIDPCDEVIVPCPYWVSYPPMVKLAGGSPRIVETTEDALFKITPQAFKRNITKKTRAIIINSPSNPTGAVYSPDEVEEITEIALKSNVFIISDEIYEKLTYGETPFVSPASLSKEAKNSTIVINGVSKTYAMTGFRIGYAAGPKEVIRAMTRMQSQSTSNPASISQWASVEALTGGQDSVRKMVEEFKKRRNLMVESLNSIKGIRCAMPHGAFYVFANVDASYGKKFKGKTIDSSAGIARYLLEEALVAVVPGEPFGNDGYIRLSYACSEKDIRVGVQRIKDALGKLH